MVVIAISVLIGTAGNAPATPIENAVFDWLDQQTRELTSLDMEFEFVNPPKEELPSHYRGLWRVKFSNEPHTLPAALSARLDEIGLVEWYQLKYHLCSEDDPDYTDCGDWIVIDQTEDTPEMI